MEIAPQAAAALQALTRTGLPPPHRRTPAQARRAAAGFAALQGAAEPVARVVDVAGPVPLRVVHPHDDGPLPALVHFHGGGWVAGDLDLYDRPARALARHTGHAVVLVDYRRAPEHRFPAPLDDCCAATRWVVEHAPELGLDPARVGVSGDSAGGNLAAAVCLRLRAGSGPSPAGQVLIYPVTDHAMDTPSYRAYAEGYGLSAAAMRWNWRQYLARPEDGADPLASPLRAADLAGLPPAVVYTAELDPLRDEGERYAARLRAAGVPVVLRRWAGLVHGFFLMGAAIDRTGDVLAAAGRHLRELSF
jgi:acetyl esterase